VEDHFLNNLRTRVTYGERISDDCNIDLVAPTASGELEIAVHTADNAVIVPKFERDGMIHIPPTFHPSIRDAIRFPAGIADYGEVHDFFLQVAQLLRTSLKLPEPTTFIITAWIFAGWVPEFFAVLPILCVTGSNRAHAMKVFYLLRELCRRAIIVAELNPHLPTELGPTLLLVNSGLPKRVQGCWSACNHRDVYLPAPGVGLKRLACVKAIYGGTGDPSPLWGDEVLRVVLLPNHDIPVMSAADLAEIAAEFQAKFQMFRLRRLQDLAQAGKVSCPAVLARSAITRDLFAVLGGESRVPQLLLPLAENQLEAAADWRAVDPMAVIIEVIWIPAHQQDAITMLELQKRVNTLLAVRGETTELSVREVGWKLRDLGLPRRRTAKGMSLRFSRELRARIHELAGQFGLELPKPESCRQCAPAQIVEG